MSLRDIASDPDARASGCECSAKAVLRWLSRTEHDWLIVFDNASGGHGGVAEYIPAGIRGNLLFTSRDLSLARHVQPKGCVQVGDMGEEDAILLLQKASLIDECPPELEAAARAIVKELWCLPLAVDQAGAAIASGLCSMDDYLDRYSQNRQELLSDPTFQAASNYGRAVYGTWDLSFKSISMMDTRAAESAIFLLQIFAFFHHENIAEEIIKQAVENIGSNKTSQDIDLPPKLLQLDEEGRWMPFYFREGIRTLLSFSLIKKAAIGSIYAFHPLVHNWCRDRMSHQEQYASSSLASKLVASSITFGVGMEDYAFHIALVPHIKAITQHSAEFKVKMSYDDKQCIKFGRAFDDGRMQRSYMCKSCR